jgi:hypothetical protein
VESEAAKIGICITGRVGHRGVSLERLIASIKGLRQELPEAWIAFATSDPLTELEIQSLRQVCKVVIEVDLDSPNLPYALNSLVWQTEQMSMLLKNLPGSIQFLVRMRTDWIVDNPVLFAASIRQFSLHDIGPRFVAYANPQFPIFPVPWFANDNWTCGARLDMEALWGRFDKESLNQSNKNDYFLSRRFHFTNTSTVLVPEQILWRRYFVKKPLNPIHLSTSWHELSLSHELMSTLHAVSAKEIGVTSPLEFMSTSRVGSFFYGVGTQPTGSVSTKSRVAAAWLIANILFFLHPHWVFPRLKFLKAKLVNVLQSFVKIDKKSLDK